MKTTKSIMSVVLIAAVSAVVILFSACESDKDADTAALSESGLFDSGLEGDFDSETQGNQELNPIPASAAIDTAGQVVTFRVVGGRPPFTWSVGKAASGALDKTTTNNDMESVKYTATALAANTIIVTDAKGRAAVIDITAGSKALAINPASVTFLAAELGNKAVVVQFVGSGGAGTYTWTDDLTTYGDIDANGKWTSAAAQTASSWSNKTVNITLQDSNGDTATATISAY